MPFDLREFRDRNRDFYGEDATLRDVANDLYQRRDLGRFGYKNPDEWLQKTGLDQPVLQEEQEIEKARLAKERSETDFIGGLGVLGAGVKQLPLQLAAKGVAAWEGGDVDTEHDWKDRLQEAAARSSAEFVKKYGSERHFIPDWMTPGFDIRVKDVAELPQNLAYSGVSAGAGLTAGVPVSLAPVPGARPAAWAAGGAASGKAAYNMARNEITHRYFDTLEEEKGAPLTEKEWQAAKADFDDKAHRYGLWEALPEAVGNVAGLKILSAPLKKIVGEGLARNMLGKLGALYGTELATETITQKGQAGVEQELGWREKEPGWLEALQEVAPQTILLTTVMGGAGAAGVKVYDKVTGKTKEADPSEVDPSEVIKGAAREGHLDAVPDEVIDNAAATSEQLAAANPQDQELAQATELIKQEQQARGPVAVRQVQREIEQQTQSVMPWLQRTPEMERKIDTELALTQDRASAWSPQEQVRAEIEEKESRIKNLQSTVRAMPQNEKAKANLETLEKEVEELKREGSPFPETIGGMDRMPGDGVSLESQMQGYAGPERRADLQTRKKIEEMTPEEMRYELLTDHLTGAGNRRALEETVAAAGEETHQGVVDLDSLKYVNDTFGHEAGDAMIKQVADSLLAAGGQTFRTGGDEFVILGENPKKLFETLQKAYKELEGRPLQIKSPDGSVSNIPVRFSYGTGQTLQEADTALQKAKQDREARGERAGRGAVPPGLSQAAAGGEQPSDQGRGVPDQKEVAPPLTIEEYNSKSLVVRGDTKAHKDRLVALGGGTFSPKLKGGPGWVFPRKREAEIRAAMADLTGTAEMNKPAPQATGEAADLEQTPKHEEGPHYAAGLKASQEGKPRTLPSYFTSRTNKNAKDWYRGWDAANLEREAEQPKGKALGKNQKGKAVREDGRGVRSYQEEPGIWVEQPVNMIPSRQGGLKASKDAPGELFQKGRTDFLTSEEMEEFGKIRADAKMQAQRAGEIVLMEDTNRKMPEGYELRREGPFKDASGEEEFWYSLYGPSGTRVQHKTYFDKQVSQDMLRVAGDHLLESTKDEPQPKKPAQPSGNILVTDDRAAELRKRLQEKLNRLHSGVDPEIMTIGAELAVYHIERGARSFVRFAKAMVADIGEKARPFLKAWYSGARYWPGLDAQGMDSDAVVSALDVNGIIPVVDNPAEKDQEGNYEETDVEQIRDAGSPAPGGTPSENAQGDGKGQDGPSVSPESSGTGGSRTQATGGGRYGTAPSGGDRSPSVRSGDSGGRTGGRSEPERVDNVGSDTRPERRPEGRLRDYLITPADRLGEGGAKTKFNDNVAAIRTLRTVQSENRPATEEEKKALVRYVGWGGLPQAFPRTDGSIAKGWEKQVAELRDLLTDEEYAAARRSTQDAHYTAPDVVRGIYEALQHIGFKGGRVIEPTVGTGNFIGLMPPGMKGRSKFHAVELEPLSGGIAKLLYPNQNIQAPMGFQDFEIAEGVLDAFVGNPPFGQQKLYDKKNKDITGFSIHNYIIAKALKSLRPGGVSGFVVSNFFLDKIGKESRQYIGERARFLGAIRLPNNAFSKNALTEVTTDVIFLQKLEEGEKADTRSWLETGTIQDPGGGEAIPLNRYFIDNPEMMLGDMKRAGSMYGPDQPALIARSGEDIAEAFSKAAQNLPQDVYKPASTVKTTATMEHEAAVEEEKDLEMGHAKVDGYFVTKGGKIARRLPDEMGERQHEITEIEGKAADRIKGLTGLRDTLRDLFKAEVEGDTAGRIELLRNELNKKYDTFLKQFDHVHSVGNRNAFRDDPDYPLLLSLEKNYSPGVTPSKARKLGTKPAKPSAEKSDIFFKRLRSPYTPPTHAETAKDALFLVLADQGFVDVARMAELTGKTEAAVIKELGDEVFKDPDAGWVVSDEYLSGNVKAKLKRAREMAEQDPDYSRNVAALEKVQPAYVPAAQISVRLGTPWIPGDVYESFYAETVGGDLTVSYLPTVAQWSVQTRSVGDRTKAYDTFGTGRKSANELLDLAIKGKAARVFETDRDGKRYLNQEETQLAAVKMENLKQAFVDWIFQDQVRRERLETLYNEEYNTHRERPWDGSHLSFPGMSKAISLHPHQKDVAWRMVQKGKGLFDHVVGAGKTFAMIASGIEGKRIGLFRKPMYVVPNHLVEQWSKDFQVLYPGASVLAIGKKDFTKQNRQKFVARIATGEWDAVVLAHSSFGFIPSPKEFEVKFLREQVETYEEAIRIKEREEGKKARSVKQLEKAKERLENRIKELLDAPKDDLLDFTELGVDALFVDEAHEFKNLFYVTGMERISGLGTPTGSKKALDLFVKSLYLQRTNPGGKGVYFATGTPLSNSMVEMYTMQRYMQYDEMKAQGLHHFDAWANTFANPVPDWELDPTGTRYRMQTRMKKFVNMPELMTRYRDFADVITQDYLLENYEKLTGKPWPVPKVKGGRPVNVVVPRTPDQDSFIEFLVARMDNMPKDGSIDNPLKATGEGRKAALDMRLIDPSAKDHPDSKPNRAVQEILRIHRAWDKGKGTQLVFCDLSTPKGSRTKQQKDLAELIRKAEEGDEVAAEKLSKKSLDEVLALQSDFSVYDDIRDKLVAEGIPESEIAYIHDANTDKQKEDLFERVRSGRVRVLMGSTQKMGAGMNVQNKLVALHHLDCPWRPSDLEQREGRIIRQGNEFYARDPEGFSVEILRYATERTLDARMWQVIEGKAGFIEQVRKGTDEREVEDIASESANAAEMKAAASGNPIILEEVQLRTDIRKMETLERAHNARKWKLEADVKRGEEADARLDRKLAQIDQDEKTLEANPVDLKEGEWSVTLGGKEHTVKSSDKEARKAELKKVESAITQAVAGAVKGTIPQSGINLGSFRELDIAIYPYSTQAGAGMAFSLEGKSITDSTLYGAKDKFSASGWMTRIDNLGNKIEESLPQSRETAKQWAENTKQQGKEAARLIKEPFSQADELKEKRARHAEVMQELQNMKTEEETPESLAKKAEGFVRWIALGFPEPSGFRISDEQSELMKSIRQGKEETDQRNAFQDRTRIKPGKKVFGIRGENTEWFPATVNGDPVVTNGRIALMEEPEGFGFFAKENPAYSQTPDLSHCVNQMKESTPDTLNPVGIYTAEDSAIPWVVLEGEGYKTAIPQYVFDYLEGRYGEVAFKGASAEGIVYCFDKSGKLLGVSMPIEDAPKRLSGRGSFARSRTKGRTKGVQAKALQSRIEKAMAKFEYGPKLLVVQRVADLPNGIREEFEAAMGEGLALPQAYLRSGTLYAVADHIDTMARAVELAVHESIGHYGVFQVLGRRLRPEYLSLYEQYKNDSRLKDIVRRYGLDLTTDNGKMMAANELVAHVAEEEAAKPLIKRIIAAVKRFLREAGFLGKIKDEEILDLLKRSRQYLEKGPVLAQPGRGQAATAYGRGERQIAPMFFSQMQRVLEKKLPKSGPADQFRQVITNLAKKGEFKAEEFEWSGIQQWLADQKGKVTKDQVLNKFVKKWGAKVGETKIRIDEDAQGLWDQLDGEQQAIVGPEDLEGIGESYYQPVHALNITPQMREVAMFEGLPMFARTPSRAKDPDTRAVIDKAMGVSHEPVVDRIKTWWDGFKAEGFERWQQGMFDQYQRFKTLDKEHGEMTGEGQKAIDSSYIAATMSTSLGDTMYSVLLHGAPVRRQGAVTVETMDKGLLKIFEKVGEDLDLFLAHRVGIRANELMKEGRENYFTQEEIDKLLELQPKNAKQKELWDKTWNEYVTFRRKVLDFAEQHGLVNADGRAAWDRYEHIPFYRVVDEMVKAPRNKKGIASQYSGIRRLKGGTSKLGDPLSNIVQNITHLIDASVKNHATELAIQKAEALGAATQAENQWELRKASNAQLAAALRKSVGDKDAVWSMNEDERNMMAQIFLRTYPKGKNVVHVMRDGKPVYYEITDDLLLRSLTSINQQIWGGPVMETMRAMKRLLTHTVTAVPDFMVANFIRDALHSWVISKDKMMPGFDSMKGFVKSLRQDEDMVRLMAAGGSFAAGYATGSDPQGQAKELRRLMKQYRTDPRSVLDSPQKIVTMMGKAWDKYRRLGTASENAARVQLFKNVLDNGGTLLEAAHAAKDLMDFSKRGDWAAMQFLTQTVPFLGARLQGLQRLGRGAVENPKAFLAKASMIAAASTLLYLWNRDDDRFKELEDWDKDNNYHVWIGDEHFRLPKPFEVGVLFGTIPERLTEYVLDAARGDGSERLLASRIYEAMMMTLHFDPTPQLVKPIIEQVGNKSFFTGRPIVGLGLQRLAPEEQRDPGRVKPRP